jgi:aspartate aminotransferase
MPSLSKRSASLGTENAFVVLAEVAGLAAKGKDVLSFCIGQPDFPSPPNVQEAAIKAVREGKHGYTPSAGIMPLREVLAATVAKTRGIPVEPTDVVVAAGAKPFIGYSVLSVTDYGAGHEVLYPNPGFPIYESQIRVCGAVPVPVPLREAKNFAFDMDDLKRKITKNSRLLILNYPHNPTGGMLTRKELEEIATVVLQYPDLWVYADEIYGRLVYDGEFFSIARIPGMAERTIIADGASKTYAMTGWRIGFAVNRTLAPYFTTWVTNTESCACHVSQFAALEAFSGTQEHAEKMHKTFHERRDVIVKLLGELPGVTCRMPLGAFYVWPNVTELCRMTGTPDSEELRKRLLHEAGVAVLADIHFGPRVEGDGQHIRFSYAASTEAIQSGVARVSDWIRKNRK